VTALVAGETQLMFTTAASAIGQIRGGRLRVLAVTSARRMEQLPSTPTMMELGYPDFLSSSWQGVFVPVATPREVVDRLFTVLHQTLKTPDIAERLAQGGAYVATSTNPKAFADFVTAETQRWGKVAKESGATVD
jgi:tripartite-type tricarboxylate transporter receptor subunit TctC